MISQTLNKRPQLRGALNTVKNRRPRVGTSTPKLKATGFGRPPTHARKPIAEGGTNESEANWNALRFLFCMQRAVCRHTQKVLGFVVPRRGFLYFSFADGGSWIFLHRQRFLDCLCLDGGSWTVFASTKVIVFCAKTRTTIRAQQNPGTTVEAQTNPRTAVDAKKSKGLRRGTKNPRTFVDARKNPRLK